MRAIAYMLSRAKTVSKPYHKLIKILLLSIILHFGAYVKYFIMGQWATGSDASKLLTQSSLSTATGYRRLAAHHTLCGQAWE